MLRFLTFYEFQFLVGNISQLISSFSSNQSWYIAGGAFDSLDERLAFVYISPDDDEVAVIITTLMCTLPMSKAN